MEELEFYKKALSLACYDLASEMGESENIQRYINNYIELAKRGVNPEDRV